MRKICNCKDVFFTFTKNINIAEFAFKQIYKKYNIVKKRNTPFHKNFSKSTINYIILEKKFDLKVIATGTHFSKKYGYTYNEIIENIEKRINKFNDLQFEDLEL